MDPTPRTIRLPDPNQADPGYVITIEQENDFFIIGVRNSWTPILVKAGKYAFAIADSVSGVKHWMAVSEPAPSVPGAKTDLNTFLRPEIAAFAIAMQERMNGPRTMEDCLKPEDSWWKNAREKGLRDEIEKWMDHLWEILYSERHEEILTVASIIGCNLMMITDVTGSLPVENTKKDSG